MSDQQQTVNNNQAQPVKTATVINKPKPTQLSKAQRMQLLREGKKQAEREHPRT